MKIYNEVTSIFNETTGKWETISEDSFDYSGEVAYAQGGGIPVNATQIAASDSIADTIKTTAGYFTNGDGTLSGNDIHTGSLSDTNEKYYFNVQQTHPDSASAETQFSVTWGHYAGSGSETLGDTLGGSNDGSTLKGQSEAIYKQYTSLLLEETEASGGFVISSPASDSAVSSGKDEHVYVLVGKRSRFKDRINKKAWTLTLTGSVHSSSGSVELKLTDDSATEPATSTPAGLRYNIISGTLGSVASASSARCFGWFYPEMGVMIFSGAELSRSIGGPTTVGTLDTTAITASFDASNRLTRLSSSGFAPNLNTYGNPQNALRFVNCLKEMGTTNTIRLRSEEDQSQENFFCRIKANQYNFSANPTFVSGSYNKIRNTDMHGNPTTFITGVGLYNSAGQLLAIAKLSSPLKKNFASEATIKVKLTY